MADALAQGCDTLVSIGGIQSNHTRQVTGVARHLGLEAVTVQEGWVDYNDMNYDKVGNIQLTRIMGGDIRIDPAGFDIGVRDSWKEALASVEAAGGKPYPIPAGASDHPLGGLGFANWAVEVETQEAELDIFFDNIIVCTVTGSSHAGMIAGFALSDRPEAHASSASTRRHPRPDHRPGDPHRHQHRGQDRTRTSNSETTKSPSSPDTKARPTACPTHNRRSNSPRRPHRRDAHRSRSTKASRWPASSA